MKRKGFLVALLAATGLVVAPAVTADAAAPQVRSGMKISVDETLVTSYSCTLGAVVSQSKALTAGHCGKVGQPVYDKSGTTIGKITANQITRKLDIAVITLAPRAVVRQDVIAWDSSFWKGQKLSKSGITTGFGTGAVVEPAPTLRTSRGFTLAPPFLNEHATYSVKTTLRSESGDSGAGVRDANGRIVGILSSGADDYTNIAPVSRLPQALR